MQFPDLLLVEVRSAAAAEPIPDILVWINTLVRERTYYCALVGVTDPLGIARLSRVELLSIYRSDQELFPMDYKLSLAECDDVIVVGVDGSTSFLQQRETGLASGLVNQGSRIQWQRAQNQAWGSTQLRAELNTGPAPLRLTLALPQLP